MKSKYIDLHTHTRYSDGIETPSILMENLKLQGMNIVAKTDHDTLAGYEEAKQAAENIGLILVPGLEFSDKDYHILGLGFNPYDEEFNALVQKSTNNQKLATKQRIDLLQEHGIPITMEKVEKYFPFSRLGKQNIFRTLYLDKDCRGWLEKNLPDACPNDVFEYTLRKKGIAEKISKYYNLERDEIINGIHNAGGIAILAHGPKEVKNIKELYELKEMGIDGFEIQPRFYNDKFEAISYEDVERFAKENNMLLTYGSDYHGASMPRRLLERKNNILSLELEERICEKVCLKCQTY
ncbi:MAG: PHP domain-containing protein [Nanoarchaeota archaeon]|nr:PHP domain-containing protein [Nanoarchaeota archaeon]